MMIELLISIAILVVGLGGILAVLIAGMYSDNRSGQDTTSVMIGEHVLEQIAANPANSNNPISLTDCGGTVWTISTTGGKGTAGGSGATLTAAGTIDWTQSYSGVPNNYKMKYVACGPNGAQQVYDIRWNITNITCTLDATKCPPTLNPNVQMIVLSARPSNSSQAGGLRFITPPNLRTIQGI
jgi:Tfp pilus assembly protein PilV